MNKKPLSSPSWQVWLHQVVWLLLWDYSRKQFSIILTMVYAKEHVSILMSHEINLYEYVYKAWISKYYYGLLQCYSSLCPHSLSFHASFCMHLCSLSCPSWSTTVGKRPLKVQKPFHQIFLLQEFQQSWPKNSSVSLFFQIFLQLISSSLVSSFNEKIMGYF